MSNKLTLIIDGNWLLMSRLSVLKNRYKTADELANNVFLLMIKSIKIVLNTFKDIDSIVMVVDGGSWRKHIELGDISDGLKKITEVDVVEYKGTRIKDDTIDWELIFSKFDNFQDILNQHNISISREQYVEGDDWCWMWSTKLNAQGTNTIIWSKDNDLKQLVNMDSNGCFTVWWNKENGVFINNIEENDINWFFNSAYSENNKILNNIIKRSAKSTIIDPKSIVIEKIFKGDASDNIIPIALRKARNTNSSKKFKISQKDLEQDIDINNDAAVKKFFENLQANKSYGDRIIVNDIDFIMKHFEYNKKMVWLDESIYPKEILDKMNEQFIVQKSNNISDDIGIVESVLQSNESGIQDLLEDI